MDIKDLEEEIQKERRERQTHFDNILENLKEIEIEFSNITYCDKAIEAMLNREIEELRHRLYIYERDPKI